MAPAATTTNPARTNREGHPATAATQITAKPPQKPAKPARNQRASTRVANGPPDSVVRFASDSVPTSDIFKDPASAEALDTCLVSAALRRLVHLRLQREEQRVAGDLWKAPYDLVFKSEVGMPMQDGQVSWSFHKALQKGALPRIRIHDPRHTAATLLLERGTRNAYRRCSATAQSP